MPASLRTWTTKSPHLYQTFRAKFTAAFAPACRFCVNVAALTDMRVLQILIETLSNMRTYSQFEVTVRS